MKKLLLILLCLPMIGLGQQMTYVPDDNFEAYLEANGMGNGIPNDDYVTTANINTVTTLDVGMENISDLTGIEDFTALDYLMCFWNQLTSLDVSQNTALTALSCFNNQLTSLDVSQNTALTTLNCPQNQLTSLDVSQNPVLYYLSCKNNQLTSLDVSNNTALYAFWCGGNQLTNLDVRNGNNTNLALNIEFINNPNLYCIDVDDSTWSANNWTVANGNIDSLHYFSTNCSGSSTYGCTDSLACNFDSLATIDDSSCSYLTATISTTDVSCNGLCDGTATVNATGGVGLYTYVWSDGQTTATATGLCAGTYLCNVSDTNGCTVTETIIITEPVVLTAIVTTTDVSCNGGNNGTATITATGGCAPYTYLWSPNGQTTSPATGLTAGTYTYIVTDCNGCSFTTSFTITEPVVLTAIVTTTDVTCNGWCNGTATITATGGCAPYNINWGMINPNAICAGTYTYIVSDCNGCSYTASFTITEPVVLTAIVTTTDVTCNGANDGTISIVGLSGGTSPYTFSWTGPNGFLSISQSLTITGLSPGTYTLTVTDNNGCSFTTSATITQPLPLISYDTLSVTTSILWNGMTLTLSGDYSFTLTNSVGCDSIVNLNLTINPSGILNITNTEKTLLKVTDVLGRETPYKKRTPLFYIYDDGTVEKRIVIE